MSLALFCIEEQRTPYELMKFLGNAVSAADAKMDATDVTLVKD